MPTTNKSPETETTTGSDSLAASKELGQDPLYGTLSSIDVVDRRSDISPYDIPIPIPPMPLLTVSPVIAFHARTLKAPKPLPFQLLAFGEDPETQNRTTERFFHKLITLIHQQKDQDLTNFLIQLGKDCQKYNLTHEDIETLVTSWQESFHNDAHPQFVNWIADLKRPLLVGLTDRHPMTSARVFDCEYPEPDLMVLKLLAHNPPAISSGQYCEASSERHPGKWRYFCNAMAANPLGQLEFHIRGSDHIFTDTKIDDIWYIGQIHGEFGTIAYQSERLLLIGYDTGLSPFRSIIYEQLRLPHSVPTTLVTFHKHKNWFDRDIFLDASRNNHWLTLIEDITTVDRQLDEKKLVSAYRKNTTADIIISGPQDFMSTCRFILHKNRADPQRIHCIQAGILGISTTKDQWDQI